MLTISKVFGLRVLALGDNSKLDLLKVLAFDTQSLFQSLLGIGEQLALYNC